MGKRLVSTIMVGLIITSVFSFVPPAQALSVTVFSTDFNSGAPAQFSGVTTTESVQGYAGFGTSSNVFGDNFLRNTSAPPAKTTLTLTGLPPHTGISIGFLLAIIDSWDGQGCNVISPGFPGPDIFNVTVNGALIFSHVFENSNCGTQTYVPPAGVTLARRLPLGFTGGSSSTSFFNDSAYNMGLDPVFQNIPHTSSTLTIEWFAGGSGWQGGTDESWAIDNVEVILQGVQCTPPPSGLISWWPGDGNANDIQDNNPGILQNGASFAAGKVAQAFSLDGIDDHISVAHNSNLNPVAGQGWTVDAWVNPSVLVPNVFHVIAHKGNSFGAESTTEHWAFFIRPEAPRVLGFEVAKNGAVDQVHSSTGLVAGVWQHVAVVVTSIGGSASGYTFYINGVDAGRTIITDHSPGSITTTEPLRISAAIDFATGSLIGFFNGQIDELEIYNRALTQSEIQSIFYAGSAGKCKPAPTCVPPPANLVSWWPGDNNANDIQDANPGTLQNGATFAVGNVAQAFSLDGTNDFVEIADAPNLDITNQLTIDAWIKMNLYTPYVYPVGGFGTNSRIVDKITAGFNDGYLLDELNGKLRFIADFGSVVSSSNIPLNTWTHVAGVYDGSTVKVYINGVLEGSATAASGTIPTNSHPVRIGTSQGNPPADGGSPFNGLIDEVEIFNRALTATEIQSIVNAGSAGKCKPAQECTPPPPNMISWWPGDGNANDIIDNNPGTLQNGATFAAGKVGQAFSLDGIDDFVDINDSPSLSPSDKITLSAWVNPSSVVGTPAIIAKFGSDTPDRSYYMLIDNGRLRFILNNRVMDIQSAASIPVNQWTYVAVTSDGTIAKLYINGVQDTNTGTPPATITDSSVRLAIGQRSDLNVDQYVGLIDEVEIYNRALTSQEIQAIHNAGSAGKCKPAQECTPPPPNMVSWWPGDGNANDIADNNPGTLIGGTTFATGKVGQAFSFDGSGGVLTTANTNLNAPKQFTIDAWIKPTQLARQNDIHIIVNKENPSRSPTQYEIGVSPGLDQIPAGNLAIFTGAGGLPDHHGGWTDGGGPVPLNQFTHVTLVVNFDIGKVTTYINGQVAKEYVVSTGLSVPTVQDAPLRIGFRTLAPPVGAFVGAIDEVEFFNRALSQSEILSIFNAGSAGKCKVPPPPPAPQLTVIKNVINDNGGTKGAADFSITVNGGNASPANFAGADTPGTAVSLNAGSYTVSETGPSGYSSTLSTDCTGTIAVGQQKTCTITNDDIAPQLIVIKHVINDNGGTATAGQFTMTVTGNNPSPASFPGAEAPGTTVMLNAGSYSVTETGPAGYAASFSADCSGSISIGETKTCTVTNDDTTEVTRTLGYWSTHLTQASDTWADVVAAGEQLQCTGFDADNTAKLMGGFWSSITRETDNDRRSLLDQARMQLAQQLLAAILNKEAFDNDPDGTVLSDARAAFCGSDRAAMLSSASVLDAFNNSGDDLPFPPGFVNTNADPTAARAAADKAFWDQPNLPG